MVIYWGSVVVQSYNQLHLGFNKLLNCPTICLNSFFVDGLQCLNVQFHGSSQHSNKEWNIQNCWDKDQKCSEVKENADGFELWDLPPTTDCLAPERIFFSKFFLATLKISEANYSSLSLGHIMANKSTSAINLCTCMSVCMCVWETELASVGVSCWHFYLAYYICQASHLIFIITL